MKKALVILLVFTLYVFAQVAGVITAVGGEAYIQRNTKLLPAKIGMDVYNKDMLVTKEGRLQVEFKDRTVINVGKESRFSVKEYLFEGTNAKADFNMAKGFFRTITGKIGKIAPKKFKIQTKNSTIGIRGTIIVLFTSPIEGDEIACLDGKIAVVSRYTRQMVVVPAGRITFVKPHASPTPPKPLTLMKKGTKVLGGEKKQKKSQPKQASQQQSQAKSQGGQQSSQPQPKPGPQQPAPTLQISPEEPQTPQTIGDIETESTQAQENEKYEQVEEAQSSSASPVTIPTPPAIDGMPLIPGLEDTMHPGEIQPPSSEGASSSTPPLPQNFDDIEQPPTPNSFDNIQAPPAVGASSSSVAPPSGNGVEFPPSPSLQGLEFPPNGG